MFDKAICLDSLKRIIQRLKELPSRVVDTISEFSGYAAVRVPLRRAKGPREVTLDIVGYRQIDSYSCGGVAAAMAVRFLRPRMSFESSHDAVNPVQPSGAGFARVARGLRSLGIRVSWRKNLTFDDICDAVDAECPVLVSIKTRDSEIDHWVVVYGYGRRPDLVFVAGIGVHFFPRNRMLRREFRRLWFTPGEGLVCSKATRQSLSTRSK